VTPERYLRIISEIVRYAPPHVRSDVFYFHDDGCPCEQGREVLMQCECDPWVKINGVIYEIRPDGSLMKKLVWVEREQ
jgi:hypothetical protein